MRNGAWYIKVSVGDTVTIIDRAEAESSYDHEQLQSFEPYIDKTFEVVKVDQESDPDIQYIYCKDSEGNQINYAFIDADIALVNNEKPEVLEVKEEQ